MLEMNVSVLINKPAKDVFELWCQPERYPEWFTMSLERRPLSDGPIGVGSRFSAVDKMPPGRRIASILEITAFEPNIRIAATLSAPINATWESTFEETDGRTQMTFTTSAKLSGLQGLLAPLFKGWANRQLQGGLDKFKAAAEGG